jgi:hypothetical protein
MPNELSAENLARETLSPRPLANAHNDYGAILLGRTAIDCRDAELTPAHRQPQDRPS